MNVPYNRNQIPRTLLTDKAAEITAGNAEIDYNCALILAILWHYGEMTEEDCEDAYNLLLAYNPAAPAV
jgi:hypothetical protein